MLGSVQDAEDALQDALLRAWRGLDRFEGRSSPRSWLYRIATNTCLDAIARRPKRVLPIDYEDAPSEETSGSGPCPDELAEGYEQRESIELAFIAALQHLPANQRAVLILREVLGFSAKEVAAMLDTTPASVNSAMQRARVVGRRAPARALPAGDAAALDDDEIRALVERYIDAWDRGDVDAVVAMLAEEATFSMPPNAEWFRGREAIRDFLPRGPLSIPRRFVATRANGQLAFGTYKLSTASGWRTRSTSSRSTARARSRMRSRSWTRRCSALRAAAGAAGGRDGQTGRVGSGRQRNDHRSEGSVSLVPVCARQRLTPPALVRAVIERVRDSGNAGGP